jgi:uncharacterized protein
LTPARAGGTLAGVNITLHGRSLGNDRRLGFDRSMRSFDTDGRMHVETCNISKAVVNPYYGREIPNAEALGLRPDKVYYLYRDPTELAAAAPTFRNLPLLETHIAISAEAPAKDLWVGTIGSDVRFEAPYLKASLAVWDQKGIDFIENEDREQLSSAYRYRADMTPGKTPTGELYDGVMRDIIGNHVALVEEGRAGPDVVVADQSPSELPKMPRHAKLIAALAQFIRPDADLIALDKAMDATEYEAEDELTDEDKKAADAMVRDRKAKDGKKGMDAEPTDKEKEEAYAEAKDKKAKDRKAKDAKAAADKKAADKAAADKKARDAADPSTGRAPEGGAPNPAVDSVTKDEALKMAADARAAAVKDINALHAAKRAVEAICGDVALDSADEVYAYALKQAGVDITGVHASAYPALVQMHLKTRARPAPSLVALDGRTVAEVSKVIPGLAGFKQA